MTTVATSVTSQTGLLFPEQLPEDSPRSEKTFLAAIQEALHLAMAHDPNVCCLGEDIGLNGGVFRVTDGLQAKYGDLRVLDTPLSECGILGVATGMAMYGLRPVAEIQFSDYMFPGFDQIVSEMAKTRYRSGADYTCPVVVRSPYGGGIKGGLYHSQSPEAYYTHTPGLQVVIPSTPYDAKGLLLSAIASNDPVIYLEPKRIYRSMKESIPEAPYSIPLGKARLVQEGSELTIVTYGAMVDWCQKAAERLHAEEGASIEIVDLRSLVPLDEATILASLQKTGRVVVVHEAPKTGGFASEIAALIAEKAVDSLKAPVRRVTGFDTPFPYSLEAYYLPHPARILQVLRETLFYQ
jgi:pyruvate dehydrogenase E1 component beta subunit